MRYQGSIILKTEQGARYFKAIKYPSIPLSENDVYIIATVGERLDTLALDYYKNEEDYWIISIANGLPGDSLYLTPGTQVRIPQNILRVKQDFNELNGI